MSHTYIYRRRPGVAADLWRDTPLCMSQYRRLFGAHRKAVVNDPDEMRICEVRGRRVGV